MISVLINVYHREVPEYFHVALQSIYNQTFQNFEVILVIDGPIPQGLQDVVDHWVEKFGKKIRVIRLEKNSGIACAINAGLKECSYDLVAKMDSDDYSVPDRLRQQYEFMQQHPEIDVLGSNMGEFEYDPNKIHMIRLVPKMHEEIVNLMWMKCPMNHVTVMYRKSATLSVGGYDPSYGNDDFLWVKMRQAGFRFYNLENCLVHARVGNSMKEMIKRRGTLELFRWNMKIRTYMLLHRMMGVGQYLVSVAMALMVFLLPISVKSYLFKKTRKVLA